MKQVSITCKIKAELNYAKKRLQRAKRWETKLRLQGEIRGLRNALKFAYRARRGYLHSVSAGEHTTEAQAADVRE